MTTLPPTIQQDLITKEEFKRALPNQFTGNVTQDVIDQVNQLLADPELASGFRENIIGCASVLNDGRYKLTDYLNAVRYCTYKLRGDTNTQAWTKTFPDRYAELQAKGVDAKSLSATVSMFNKGKLVTAIMSQTLVPLHIMYDDFRHRAIQELMVLGTDMDVSPKVRSDSLDRLLTHLKPPEGKTMELNVNVREDNKIDSMKAQLAILAQNQKAMIEGKLINAKQAAHQELITKETEDE